MRIVVIGASGNIGSAAVRELTARGHQVVGVARRKPDLPGGSESASVHWEAADVETDPLLPLVQDADAVVHLGWKFQPTHDAAQTWRTNVLGTQRLIDAVRRAEVPALVVASSIAALSPKQDDRPVGEEWPTDGASTAAYCREKAYNERVLDIFEAQGSGTRVVRLRPAFVFQRSAASEQRRIFGGALARPVLFDRRFVPVLPLPRGLRMQAVHAGDVGQAVAAAVEREVRGAFNLAAQGVLTRSELGKLMHAPTIELPVAAVRAVLQAGWVTRALPVPGDLLTALMQVPTLSAERARRELAWRPRHDAVEAVAAMLSGAAHSAGSQLPPLHP